MKLLSNLSIRVKLTAVVSLLFWTVSIFIFIFFPARLKEQAQESLHARSQALAGSTALIFGRDPTLHAQDVVGLAVESAKQDTLLSYLLLYDKDGRLLYAYGQAIAEKAGYTTTLDRLSPSGGISKAAVAVMSGETRVGTLYLGLSTRTIEEQVAESQTSIALIGLIIFLIGVVTVIAVATVITNPLRNMVETVEQIAGGDYVKRAHVSSQDEVGHLAFSFNQMVSNLKDAYDELEEANLTLEQRVSERTRELNEEIEERRRIEDALRESESRQRAVLSALPDLMLLRDGSGIYSPDPVLLIPPGTLQTDMTREQYAWSLMAQFEQSFNTALETGDVQLREYSIPFAHGIRYFEARIAPCGIDQTVTIVREITDRKKAEAQLHLQSTALEAAANAIVITDLSGSIIWVNAAFSQMSGYTQSEAIGKALHIDTPDHENNELRALIWRTVLAGRVWHGELPARRKDGSEYVEEQTITPVKDEFGNITHFVAIKSDISERKKIEQSLIAAKESVEAADQLKDAFIANISHGIRTPLYIMIGYLKHISSELRPVMNKEQDKYFNFVFESADKLTKSIDIILDISRLQTGTIEFHDTEISLKRLIEDRVNDARALSEAKSLALSFDNQIGDARVRTDEGFLSKSIESLVDNAIKFTRKGYVEVRLYQRDTGEIAIDVEDTGVGISEEYQNKMFLGSLVTTEGSGHALEGVGLGLALVRRYLEQIGGRITIKSARGVGSIFTLTLPERIIISTEHPSSGVLPEKKHFVAPVLPLSSEDRKLPNLLVVEDDADTRQFMRITLKKHYNVYTAESVAEAHDALMSRDINIIIADVSLGGEESGLDFVSEIRRVPRFTHVPVIAVTAHAFGSDRERCLSAGCNRYFSKPVDHAMLLKTMEELLATAI
jgi:PAS domain S-box-containing protein